MAKILILIGGHLSTAPRPQKEAETLAIAGHDVTVGGFWFEPELVARDRLLIKHKKYKFEAIVDFQPVHKYTNFAVRIQARITKEVFKKFGRFTPELLGYGVKAMLRYAQKQRADLTIVHSEGGLWVGSQLLDRGLRVGVDFEDWFSEDLPAEARANRPIPELKRLETKLARECSYCLTTSHALAEALARAYQVPKPNAIYNTFPWRERQQIDGRIRDRQNPNIPSLHWFSQTIGKGRGLESLFQALPHIQVPIEIHLRGNCSESTHQWLGSLISNEWSHLIFIHPTVPSSELLSRIAEHDIGLALEVPYCANKQFTASNKIFQYLQAGLATIATNTEGQTEVISHYPKCGLLIANNNSIALATAINDLITNPKKLNSIKNAALIAARDKFNWENQETTLLKLAEKAINK